MSKYTYILIDGYITNDDGNGNLKEVTEEEHEKIVNAIVDVVSNKGYTIGFGSTRMTEKDVENREDNLEKVDWTTGKIR